jgi:hypothetical protein
MELAFYINVFYVSCLAFKTALAFVMVCVSVDQPVNSSILRKLAYLLSFVGP